MDNLGEKIGKRFSEDLDAEHSLSKTLDFNNEIPNNLNIYTWNYIKKTIELSLLKLEDNHNVKINFDDENENNFKYFGQYNIEPHAVFINTTSSEYKDKCQIILVNDSGFYDDYKKFNCYFNIGIMSSFGRRLQLPEVKTVFITNLILDKYPELIELIKKQLKKSQLEKDFLLEVVKIIEKFR